MSVCCPEQVTKLISCYCVLFKEGSGKEIVWGGGSGSAWLRFNTFSAKQEASLGC